MNQAVEAFRGMETLIRGIESAFGSLSAEYNEASANETRLAQSMKTAMGATQEQVDAIISLTDAQEEVLNMAPPRPRMPGAVRCRC